MDNNFKTMPFGNAIGYKLEQKQMISNIYNRIERYFKIDLSKAHGKYFVNINNRDINVLIREKHWCCFSLTVKPILLYLTKYAGISFCFYVSDTEIVSVKHSFAEKLFEQETVFECEIAGKNLLISDIIVYNGRDTNQMFFSEKLEIINDIVDKQYKPDEILDCYTVKTKDFVEYSQLKSFWNEYRIKQDYKDIINGVIFRPRSESPQNVVYIVNGSWKPPKGLVNESDRGPITNKINHTKYKKVCFKMYRTNKPDVYHLYLNDGLCERYYDYASIPTKEISRKIIAYYDTGKYLNKYIFANCKFDSKFGRWCPFQKSSRSKPDDIVILGMS